MALYATNRFAGDGTTTQYEINFVGQYIERSHVKAYVVDDNTKARTPVAIASGQWLNATTITGFAPTPVGKTLVIYRDTPKPPMVDFVNGSRFTEYNLDLVARQGLFVAMEAIDNSGSEAIDDLLRAIDVVTGLVNQATAAVSDATAAALAAAGSAAEALGHANAAQAARAAAETARNAAQASAGDAATSAATAQNSANAAGSSASAARASEARAGASATLSADKAAEANGYSSSANTAATNASTSAINARNAQTAAEAARDAALAAKNSGMHCKLVPSSSNYFLHLVRWGGKTMIIDGEAREIPTTGLTLSLPAGNVTHNIYAYWTGSAVALEYSPSTPSWLNSQGYWTKAGDTSRTYVGSAWGSGLVAGTFERALRSAYNERTLAVQQGISLLNTGTWTGSRFQLATGGFLTLPGDVLEVAANVNIMSTPGSRVGDFDISIRAPWQEFRELAKDRKSFVDAYHWNGFYVKWKGMRGMNDAPQWVEPYAEFWAISSNGGAWTTFGPTADYLVYGAEPAL